MNHLFTRHSVCHGAAVALFTILCATNLLAQTAPDPPIVGSATPGDGQATVTFLPPLNDGGDPIVSYTVTASPGGASASGAGSPLTVTGLSNGTSYTFSVVATNSTGTSLASGSTSSITPQGAQTITFGNPGAQLFGTSPTLSASATSGLSPTFTTSTSGVCSITSGGSLTFVIAGTCTINADQAGDSTWAAAPTVSQSFSVTAALPGAPTIGLATGGDAQASISFVAPGFTGGAGITGYTVTASPGGFTGSGASSPVTVSGLTNGTAYTFTVTATNVAGTGSPSSTSNSTTPKGAQTITFANPGAQNFGTTPTLSATASSSLTVAFTSSTTGVCTITSGGALTFLTASTCTINADQAGDTTWAAAPTVSRSFTVNAVVPGAPTIGSATAGDSQATVSFSAPALTGGASITGYTVTSSPGGLTGNGAGSPLVVSGLTNGTAYTFTVTATNSAGTGSASSASNSVTPKGAQTITFANPGAQNFGTNPTPAATASSGLTATFTSSTTGVCTIGGNGSLTFLTTGTCTINADQAGDATWAAAPTVSRSFTVNAVVPGAPTIGMATAGDTQAIISFTAPIFTGGSSVTGYTVTSNPGGLTGTGAASPIVVTGLTNGTAYTFTVTATNSAGAGSASAASNSVTPSAAQTITFASPGAQNFGTTPTLTATASSGLTPTFTSSTAPVCTITSGGALTFVAAGTCTINADQAGNSAFSAAPTVTRSFSVNAVVPDAPTNVSAAAGNGTATISFVAPVFTGGAPITSYTVTTNPGGITRTSPASPIMLTGLANGVTYTFRVAATNSAGTGAAATSANTATTVAQPASLSIAGGNNQTSPKGTPFNSPLMVYVSDINGGPAAGVPVQFSVSAGSASLNNAYTITSTDGTAQTFATPTAPGPIAISASVNGQFTGVFSESGLSPAGAPQLSVLPGSITFTAVQGGTNPAAASLAVSNTGTGALQWTASAADSWLLLASTSGSTPATIAANVALGSMAAGKYQSSITVVAGSQQQTIPVVLNVQPPAPAQLTLAPGAIVVNVIAGSTTPIARSVEIGNSGSGILGWTASTGSGSSWLSLTSSAIGATPSILRARIDPSGLTAGQYFGTISLAGVPGGTNPVSPATVSVILNVTSLPDLITSVPTLEFRGQAGSQFASQAISVTTSTGSGVSFTATSGANWLTLNGGSGSTPGTLTAAVNTTGMSAGKYVGYVTVQSAEARNTLVVPVVLDLGDANTPGSLSASPGGLVIPVSSSSTALPTRTVALSSSTASYTWSATVTDGATWLSVSPASGAGNGALTVSVNPEGLAAGVYSGQIAVSATGTANSWLTIPVSMVVGSGSLSVRAVTAATTTLLALQPSGGFLASAGVPVTVQAAVLTTGGTPVLGGTVTVSLSNGDAPVTLIDAGDGTYVGVWTPMQSGPVSLEFAGSAAVSVVTGAVDVPAVKLPVLSSAGPVSAAGFTEGMPLGVGSISALFGQDLTTQAAAATAYPLPTSLAGVSLTINGVPAPLFYAGPGQINFFVPWELAGQTTATIAVQRDSNMVEIADVPLAPQSPGVFVVDPAEDAAAVHLDGETVSGSVPAAPGEIIEIFATGLGPVTNPPASGAAAGSTLAVNQTTPQVSIGGIDADVSFAGLAPGFAGLYQLNVVVPAALPAGPAALVINAGSLVANQAILQIK